MKFYELNFFASCSQLLHFSAVLAKIFCSRGKNTTTQMFNIVLYCNQHAPTVQTITTSDWNYIKPRVWVETQHASVISNMWTKLIKRCTTVGWQRTKRLVGTHWHHVQWVRSSSAKRKVQDKSLKTQAWSKTQLKTELDLATKNGSKNILRPNFGLRLLS